MKNIYILLCIIQTICLLYFINNKNSDAVKIENKKIEKFRPKILPFYEHLDTTCKKYCI